MTRVFTQDNTAIKDGFRCINMIVKDNGRLIAVFQANFHFDELSTFTTLNYGMPLSFIGQETTRFMARAYSIISGLDAGFLEFELCQDL